MALSPSYQRGTIDVSNGGLIVRGNGTSWLSGGIIAGDVLACQGLTVSLDEVLSDTELRLAFPWPGGSLLSSVYEIRITPDASRVAVASLQAIIKIAEGDFIALDDIEVGTAPAGSQVQLSGGVLMIPRGKPGAVNFGEITVATGAPGSAVTYDPNTGELIIPAGRDGEDGDVSQAQMDQAVASISNLELDLKSAPEDLEGRRAIILDSSNPPNLVLGLSSDGALIGNFRLPEGEEGPDVLDVEEGMDGAVGIMLDGAGDAILAAREDGLDLQPSGRLVGRLMDPLRQAGVPADALMAGRDSGDQVTFTHGSLGPRPGRYRIGAAGLPEVKSDSSILILHYGQSNAGTVGDPIAALDLYPAHVVVPNDGRWQYGYNNMSAAVNLSGFTGFRPSDLVASGKASVVTAAGMVVAEQLKEQVSIIARAEGRPAQAFVQENGVLFQADGVTLSQNFLNFIAVALKCCEVAAADGRPVRTMYVPFTHQEGDNLTSASVYAGHMRRMMNETETRMKAAYPNLKIVWLLDELAGWSDRGNARSVRNALPLIADERADTVLVGPRYPYPLRDEIHWSGRGQAQYAPLLGHAIAALERGLSWQCPRMSNVSRTGAEIVVDWTSDLPIVLDPWAFPMLESVLGFSLAGVDNGATIQSVSQSGPRQLRVTLSAVPTGSTMRLRYAWRDPISTAPVIDHPFGNGGVRDAFAVPSPFFPGEEVKRFALGFEAPI